MASKCCPEWEEQYRQFWNGVTDNAAFNEHLDNCSICQKAFDEKADRVSKVLAEIGKLIRGEPNYFQR